MLFDIYKLHKYIYIYIYISDVNFEENRCLEKFKSQISMSRDIQIVKLGTANYNIYI